MCIWFEIKVYRAGRPTEKVKAYYDLVIYLIDNIPILIRGFKLVETANRGLELKVPSRQTSKGSHIDIIDLPKDKYDQISDLLINHYLSI
jgi:DNA-binding cell septation regulator SpoVG